MSKRKKSPTFDSVYAHDYSYDEVMGVTMHVPSFGAVKVADIRGWGYLTGGGSCALGMHEDVAAPIQDAMGNLIVRLLNEHFTKTTP